MAGVCSRICGRVRRFAVPMLQALDSEKMEGEEVVEEVTQQEEPEPEPQSKFSVLQ